jgi:hypothetical protein
VLGGDGLIWEVRVGARLGGFFLDADQTDERIEW